MHVLFGKFKNGKSNIDGCQAFKEFSKDLVSIERLIQILALNLFICVGFT